MTSVVTKLPKPPSKSNKRLGAIPSIDDASSTLAAPEHAPAAPEEDSIQASESVRKARQKTERTIPFSTRVSAVFDREFRDIAHAKRLKHVELLEEMLDLYKKQ